MYGFRLTYGIQADWGLQADEQSFVRHFADDTLSVWQWSLKKFERDKLWHEDTRQFVAVEGVLFNRDEALASLEQKKSTIDWRGTWACVRYDKGSRECCVYNDHIGSKILFWCSKDGGILVSSDIAELRRISGLSGLNEHFAEQMLHRGYTLDDSTVYNGIHRLCAGQVLRIRNGEAKVEQYHHFRNTPAIGDEDKEAHLDALFRQAVERVIRKNEEEGLQHFFPLSGGLDSRMAQIVAHQIAKAPITNFTYSQTSHYDHLLPQEISRSLGNEWQFLPLDGGDYLKEIDAISKATQWLINYNGPSEIWYFTQSVDWTDKGMVLTGVNGDNILSLETDGSREISRLYSLSFAANGIGSPQVLQRYTESYSPYCDVDLLEYALRISWRERWNYAFYDRWIERFYPEAAQWLHKGHRIGKRPKVVLVCGRNIALNDLPKRAWWWVLRRLHIYESVRQKKGESMTPYDTWWNENPQLRKTLEHYFTMHIDGLSKWPQWRKRCEEQFRFGSVYDKCAVLTLLSAMR